MPCVKSWRGGIHPQENKKRTEHLVVRAAAYPAKVILPLQQNLGCPCSSLVKVGDEVAAGQKIADAEKFVSAPLHAPISGKVTRIEKLPNACGFDVESIVIEKLDGIQESGAQNTESRTLEMVGPEEIRKIIREAGIVGLGGATFPTHVKLSPPKDKPIDTIIINGCECEPYITADHRVMLEKTADVLQGAMIAAKAVGANRIVVGVEDNKADAYEALRAEILNSKSEMARQARHSSHPESNRGTNSKFEIQITKIKTKYPQGGEKQLIKALLDREVPSGGLPYDVGVVVQNVATAAAIAEAVLQGKSLIQRVLTVTGGIVKEPANLLVKFGTTFAELIEQCGGLTGEPVKVIMGGPMMGITVHTLDVPVVKATSSILVMGKDEAKLYEEIACIRCGRCNKVCPAGLQPNFLADYIKLKNWELVKDYNVADCIECGCCSFVCPSRINLVQYFKLGKKELQTRKAVCK